eukprot:scaffold103184_cov19-Tisochrysis_lutea.AAC.1
MGMVTWQVRRCVRQQQCRSGPTKYFPSLQQGTTGARAEVRVPTLPFVLVQARISVLCCNKGRRAFHRASNLDCEPGGQCVLVLYQTHKLDLVLVDHLDAVS